MPRGRVSPREADRMMKRMGIQMSQLEDVTRVVLEAPTRKIVIEGAEVATMTVQGQVIYQIGGGSVRTESIVAEASVDDARLVAEQAGVSVDLAAGALKESKGDLAQAIVLLKQRGRKTG